MYCVGAPQSCIFNKSSLRYIITAEYSQIFNVHVSLRVRHLGFLHLNHWSRQKFFQSQSSRKNHHQSSSSLQTHHPSHLLTCKYFIFTIFTLIYHTCPKIWNSPFFYLLMCLKYCCCMANSVDLDQMPHSAVSDLGLYCLQRSICPNT